MTRENSNVKPSDIRRSEVRKTNRDDTMKNSKNSTLPNNQFIRCDSICKIAHVCLSVGLLVTLFDEMMEFLYVKAMDQMLLMSNGQ